MGNILNKVLTHLRGKGYFWPSPEDRPRWGYVALGAVLGLGFTLVGFWLVGGAAVDSLGGFSAILGLALFFVGAGLLLATFSAIWPFPKSFPELVRWAMPVLGYLCVFALFAMGFFALANDILTPNFGIDDPGPVRHFLMDATDYCWWITKRSFQAFLVAVVLQFATEKT